MNRLLAYLMDEISYRYLVTRKRKSFNDNLRKYLNLLSYKSISPKLKKNLINKKEDYNIYEISFKSPVITPFRENNIVCGKLYKQKYNSPSVIILHGWAIKDLTFFDSATKRFADFGFNSVVFELPYHLRRKPKGTFSGEYTISPNVQLTHNAIYQSIIETRIIISYLKKFSQNIGLFGVSFGGMIAGLLISTYYTDDIRFAILVNPISDAYKVFMKGRIRNAIININGNKITYSDLKNLKELLVSISPVMFEPKIDKKNILLVSSIYDTIVPPNTVIDLWRRWDKPKMIKYPHGHLSVLFFEKRFFRDIFDFIGSFSN